MDNMMGRTIAEDEVKSLRQQLKQATHWNDCKKQQPEEEGWYWAFSVVPYTEDKPQDCIYRMQFIPGLGWSYHNIPQNDKFESREGLYRIYMEQYPNLNDEVKFWRKELSVPNYL
jgi:hypothetical protein